jgi:hypothetical protein
MVTNQTYIQSVFDIPAGGGDGDREAASKASRAYFDGEYVDKHFEVCPADCADKLAVQDSRDGTIRLLFRIRLYLLFFPTDVARCPPTVEESNLSIIDKVPLSDASEN